MKFRSRKSSFVEEMKSRNSPPEVQGTPPKQPCRFFRLGQCKLGSDCPFSHEYALTGTESGEDVLSRQAKSQILCKFFFQGNCKNAAFCQYSHSEILAEEARRKEREAEADEEAHMTATNDGVLRGIVFSSTAQNVPRGRSGSPEAQDPAPVAQPSSVGSAWAEQPPPNRTLCSYHVNGSCRYGDHCRFVHAERCGYCGKNVLFPEDCQENQLHLEECRSLNGPENTIPISGRVEPMTEHISLPALPEEFGECGICYENTSKAGRKFGLLSGCDHVFCLKCIREWRTVIDQPSEVIRTCPLCRVASHFIIPSDYFPRSEEEKEAIVDAYRQRLYNIPCKHFDTGNGSCPFGSSCFYGHFLKNGNRDEGQKPRRFVAADGQLETMKAVKLSDFITKVLEDHEKGRKQR